MRSALAVFAVALAGCPSTTVVTDLAIVTGCHQPEACMDVENCDCNRGDVDVMTGGACVKCVPNVMFDTCGSCAEGDAGVCREPSQVCYGRGPVCPGVGAKCVPGSQVYDGGPNCGAPEAAPPEPVQSDDDGGISAVEYRCAYADDVCCPGESAGPDLGANDLSAVYAPDLSSSD